MMDRARRPRDVIDAWKDRSSVYRSSMSGRRSRLQARRNPQSCDRWRAAGTILSSSTATASCGRTSSRLIAGLPSRAGSSRQPRTAVASAHADVSQDSSSRSIGAIADWAGIGAGASINRLMPLLALRLGPLRKRGQQMGRRARRQFRLPSRGSRTRDGFRNVLHAAGGRGFRHRDPHDPRRRAGARTGALPPACCICGIRRPTARAFPPIRRGSTRCSRAIACAALRGLADGDARMRVR